MSVKPERRALGGAGRPVTAAGRALCWSLLWTVLVALSCARAPAPDAIPTPGEPDGHGTLYQVPMRDGVQLATTVYLPEGDGPWPAILRRTPYDRTVTMAIEDGQIARIRLRPEDTGTFTDRGFAFVVQDVRGRFASEGVFAPYEGQIEDGYDAVEWLAAQPFSNGRVGISGTSALGIHANLAAAAAPPHLEAAFVVVAPASLFHQGRFLGGVFKQADGGGWMKSQGMNEAAIRSYAARAVLDERWLASDFVFHRQHVRIPIYNVGGWYDLFAAGSVDDFRYLQQHGHPAARGRQKLLMGAFGHGPELTGDLAYPGEPGLFASADLELRWFDHWLRDIDTGIMDEPAVRYYEMASARKGAASPRNGYRQAPGWPPTGVSTTRLYLADDGRLTASAPIRDDASTVYRFDPSDPVPTHGGANLMLPIGPADQRAIGERPDYLRFETEPLDEDVLVTGEVSLDVWVSSDAPDTDFVAKLVDVYPDGYEALILDSIQRMRFRDGRREQDVRMLSPGQTERIEIVLGPTANRFEAGHRIALHISSSNAPRFEPNPNTGAPLHDASGETRVARNVVYHDRAHPSALRLEVRASP